MNKPFTITSPLDDQKIVQIDRLFQTLFKGVLEGKALIYTGNGGSSQTIVLGLKAVFVYIQKIKAKVQDAMPNGNAVFAMRDGGGLSYVPGTGYVTDGVKSFTSDGITVGSNTNVNTSGQKYLCLAVG